MKKLLIVSACAALFCAHADVRAGWCALALVDINVEPGGKGNGTTWEHAYEDLQEALTDDPVCDEIWVAQGTYKPGSTRLDRFALVDGTAVYGGFQGGEMNRSENAARGLLFRALARLSTLLETE